MSRPVCEECEFRAGIVKWKCILARKNSTVKPYICRHTDYPKTAPRWCPLRGRTERREKDHE
jgi:hypothetical protein